MDIKFLGLLELDYVSRAHETEICPSAGRLCHNNQCTNTRGDFFQLLFVASPGPYAQTFSNLWILML